MPNRTEKIKSGVAIVDLAKIHVGVILVRRIRAEINTLEGPEDVGGGQHNRQRREDRQYLAEVPSRQDDNASPTKPHRPGRPIAAKKMMALMPP